MLNVDKVIDDFNENELPKKLEEAQTEYYQVIGNENSSISSSDIQSSNYTTLSTNDLYSVDLQQGSIKESDQVRRIKFYRKALLEALESEEELVELMVKVEGRDCDHTGKPLDDYFG